MKENLDSKHECEFYFMDLVTPAIKKKMLIARKNKHWI
jgi:hypothetical protein